MLNDFTPKHTATYALIFGNEVEGVSEIAMQQCNACIEIPQFGMKHSLNIAVSAGVVIWEFAKKLKM
jgi:tRNA G18 (ribose-2'-O)-methylase SpoU